jgi:hypothetical protein
LSPWFPKKGGHSAFFYTCVIYVIVTHVIDSNAILPDTESNTEIQKQTKSPYNKRIAESGTVRQDMTRCFSYLSPSNSKCFIISALKIKAPRATYKSNEPQSKSYRRPQFIPDLPVCHNIVYQCVTDVRAATLVREDFAALIGRIARRLEHLHGVLPEHFVFGLPVRTLSVYAL